MEPKHDGYIQKESPIPFGCHFQVHAMNFRIGVMPGYVGRVYLAGLHVSWLGGICLVRSASGGGQRLLLLTVPEGKKTKLPHTTFTAWWFWWIWWWWVDEILMTFWFNELIVLQHFDDEDCGTIMSWWGWQWLWLWWWFQWLSWWCRFCWYIMVVTASQLRETDDCEQWP